MAAKKPTKRATTQPAGGAGNRKSRVKAKAKYGTAAFFQEVGKMGGGRVRELIAAGREALEKRGR